MILDIHTHHPLPQPEAVVSLRVGPASDSLPASAGGQLFSVGIHPWDTAEEVSDSIFDRLARLAALPEVAAIGECGVDRLRGGPLFRQMLVFRRQAEISESLGKPLVVHCVRAHDIIIGVRREMRPRLPWAVHGFRGKPSVARMLVEAGCFLAFGERFSADSLRGVPADRILAETDESPLSIEDVVARLEEARGEPLRRSLASNASLFLRGGE